MTDFNASDFGALGDGRNNDTQALQAAIDAAAAAGGGTVHLSGGTYLISAGQGGAALLLKAGVILEGPGGYETPATLKLANGASSTDALIESVGDHTGARFLTLDGNRAHTTGETSGWVNGDSNDVTLDHVRVTQASGYGLDLRGDNSQVQVRAATTDANGLDGIIASGLVNSQLSDTYTRDNGGNGLTVTGPLTVLDTLSTANEGHGVLVVGDADGTAATLISGQITSNGLNAIRLEGTTNARVEQVLFSTHIGGAAVLAVGATGTQIIDNTFQSNGREGELSEVALQDSTGSRVQGNIFQDLRSNEFTPLAPTVLETGQSDTNRIEANYIGASLTAPLLVGPGSTLLANETTIYTTGTAGNDDISYNNSFNFDNRVIQGGSGNDVMVGGAGNAVLVGGSGVDVLVGTGDYYRHSSTTFRYDSVEDSYRDASSSHADQIRGFNVATDKLDVASLGFSGLGTGHDGTLALVYNAAKNITYLKSYDADDQGHRFELGLKGDYRDLLTAANFQTLIAGTEGADSLKGTTHGEETLAGGAGRDTLSGLGSDDRLDGGAGGDRLIGGAGADTFAFSALADSTVTAAGSTQGRDLITDFDINASDRIDVSALGFTGLGDGSGTSLALVYDSASDLTRLYSKALDSQGGHFEVALRGDQVAGLQLSGIDFTLNEGDRVVTSLPPYRNFVNGTEGNDVLTGGNNADIIDGGAGNDRINGGANEDWLTGGAGADTLTGGSSGDVFVFNSLEDSYRTATASHADLITDFSQGWDTLDVEALGYTALGDGTGGTLKVSYNASVDRTYVRDLTTDDQGRSFQVTLSGNQVAALEDSRFIFAHPHGEVAVELLGHSDAGAIAT